MGIVNDSYLYSSGQIDKAEFDRRQAARDAASGFSFSDFTDPVRDFVSKPLGSNTPGVYKNTVGDATDTVSNIVKDTGEVAKNIGKDTLSTANQMQKGLFDVGRLVDDPLAWWRESQMDPVFGREGQPGWWDRNGALTMLIPGVGPMVYGVGSGINAGYDYHNTGDEDALRRQARQAAAAYGANAVAGSLLPAADPNATDLEKYLRAGGRGAVTGGGSTALGNPNATGKDILTSVGVGAAGGTLGELFNGTQVVRDPLTGETTYSYNDSSLNLGEQAGNFGRAIPSTANNIYQGIQRSKDYEEALNKWLEQYRANEASWRQGMENRNNVPAPTLEERFTGTPAGAVLMDTEQQKQQSRMGRPFGSQFAQSSSQLEQPTDRMYL